MYIYIYSIIPAHRNWQIETAVWNLAGVLHCGLETRWQRFGQFCNDLSRDFQVRFPRFYVGFQKNRVGNPTNNPTNTILLEIRDKNRGKSRLRSNIKSLTTKLEFLRGVQKLACWGGSFLVVYTNNAGRLGAAFINIYIYIYIYICIYA